MISIELVIALPFRDRAQMARELGLPETVSKTEAQSCEPIKSGGFSGANKLVGLGEKYLFLEGFNLLKKQPKFGSVAV